MKNKNLSPVRAVKTYNLYIFAISLLVAGSFLLPKNSFALEITTQKLIKLTNQERVKNGLNPLNVNIILEKAASNKATDLLIGQYFSHSSPEGERFVKWVEEAGYEYLHTGENLAMDFVTAEGIVNAWMKSKTHKENILSPNYTEIGIAIKSGIFQEKPTIMVAQLFGHPKILGDSENSLTISNISGIIDDNTQGGTKNMPASVVAGEKVDVKDNKYSSIPIIYLSLTALYFLTLFIFIAVNSFYRHERRLILTLFGSSTSTTGS